MAIRKSHPFEICETCMTLVRYSW